MKTFQRSNLRLVWIVLTNAVIIIFLVTGPARVHSNQQIIAESLGLRAPEYSYWRSLTTDYWLLIASVTLGLGIVAEIRRSVMGAILNVAPYAIWLGVAIVQRARITGEYAGELSLGRVFFMVPISIILIVNLASYFMAARKPAVDG